MTVGISPEGVANLAVVVKEAMLGGHVVQASVNYINEVGQPCTTLHLNSGISVDLPPGRTASPGDAFNLHDIGDFHVAVVFNDDTKVIGDLPRVH